MSEPFKFSKAYPSDHLRSPDLGGKEVTLTIKSWEYTDKKKDKGGDGQTMEGLVLLFKESPKRFVSNVTNFKAIKELHGPEPDSWVGKAITLRPDVARFGRDMVDCIRIKGPGSKPLPTTNPFKDQ